MALHFGWFGNTDDGPDNDQLKLMEDPNPANAYYDRGTAIDRYMWYGLRTIGNFDSYKTFADKVVDLVDDTSIKVLLEIPTAAKGDSTFINSINNTYNSVSAVGGYYLEEPPQHGWIASQVEDLHDVLTKDLVVSVQQAALSTVYDTYAEHSTWLASYDYELTDPPNKVWENIETLTALGKLDAATNDFWYVMQAYWAYAAIREPTKYEVWWLAHRPIIDLAKGVMFYNYYAQEEEPSPVVLNVNDMAAQIRYESCHAAFDTAELKSTHVENLGDSNLLYSYRYYSSDYWLLVMDKDPQTDSTPTSDYPKQVKFKCDLGSRFSQFDVLNNRYANYYEDGTTGRVVGVTDPGGTWKQFDDDGTYGIGRGEVRMYRFFT